MVQAEECRDYSCRTLDEAADDCAHDALAWAAPLLCPSCNRYRHRRPRDESLSGDVSFSTRGTVNDFGQVGLHPYVLNGGS